MADFLSLIILVNDCQCIMHVKSMFYCIQQKSLSETSQPETPTNGTASLSLSVPDEEQMPHHSNDMKHSDNSSSMSSPLSPSGVFLLAHCMLFVVLYNLHKIDDYYPPYRSECILYL